VQALLWLLLPPLLVAIAHAACRTAALRDSAAHRLLTELAEALKAALRGNATGAATTSVDEVEGAYEFDPTPERTEVMAQRVEEIRQRYRPAAALKRRPAAT